MSWVQPFFVKQAKLYAMVLESLWKDGEQTARLLANFLRERGITKSKILDVPCGIGRVSVPLAKHGFSVTGLDFSPYFIETAKRKARKFAVGRRTSFVVGKMKEVDSAFPMESFDVAVNVFTSLGYGSERDDQIFFRALRRVVREEGLFIIAALRNRDYLRSHFVQNLYAETDELLVLNKNEFNESRSRLKSFWRFYRKKGNSLRFAAESPILLRLYSPRELTAILERAQWKVTAVYDSLAVRRPSSADSPTFTVVAKAV